MSDLTDKASAKVAEMRGKAEETLKSAKERASRATTDARARAGDAAESARIKARETAEAARVKAREAAATARVKSAEAVAVTRESAKAAAEKTAKGIEHNPLAALIGGLAIGAIAAALLPRTAREDETVGAVGNKVRETAANAIKTARQTGKEQLDALGVTPESARDQFRGLVDKISKAATTAAEAAGESLKKR